MWRIFIIEDEVHSSIEWEFDSFEDAILELKKRADIPWNQKPNISPCMSWETCGKNYEIIEYENSSNPWIEKNRTLVLEISAKETKWLYHF